MDEQSGPEPVHESTSGINPDSINGNRKPNPRFIIEVDLAAGTASWRIEGEGMPMATLVNSLEMAKAIFVQQQLLSMQARPSHERIVQARGFPPNLPPRGGLGR